MRRPWGSEAAAGGRWRDRRAPGQRRVAPPGQAAGMAGPCRRALAGPTAPAPEPRRRESRREARDQPCDVTCQAPHSAGHARPTRRVVPARLQQALTQASRRSQGTAGRITSLRDESAASLRRSPARPEGGYGVSNALDHGRVPHDSLTTRLPGTWSSSTKPGVSAATISRYLTRAGLVTPEQRGRLKGGAAEALISPHRRLRRVPPASCSCRCWVAGCGSPRPARW